MGKEKIAAKFFESLESKFCFFGRTVTKVDKELYEYAKDQGFRVTSNNSKPRVLLKFDNNVQLHTIASKKDVDELAAKRLIIERNKMVSKNPLKTKVIPNFKLPPFGLRQQYSMAPQATQKGVKRVISESSVHDASVLDQLKGMMGDDEQMLDYIKGLLSNSPQRKIPYNLTEAIQSTCSVAGQQELIFKSFYFS